MSTTVFQKSIVLLFGLSCAVVLFQMPTEVSAYESHPLFSGVCWPGLACAGATPDQVQSNIINNLFAVAGVVALAVFLLGAFQMVISGGNDTLLQNGKRAMKFSLVGLAVATGSFGIYRVLMYWLYTGG